MALTMTLGACGGDDDDSADDDVVVQVDAAAQTDAPTNTPDAAGTPDAGPTTFASVTDLTSAYTGPCDTVDLAWVVPNDAGYAGVIVARAVGGAVAGTPDNGTAYTVGELLTGGGEVVFVGDAAAFQDTDGFDHRDNVHYAVFAHNANNVYSPAVPTNIDVDQSLGAQVGQLSVDLTTGVVTPTSAPNFTLAGTAVFDLDTTTLTVTVDMTNGACRAVHNGKLVVTATNEAAAVPAGDYTGFDGNAGAYFGPTALGDATTGQRVFTFTAVSGAVDPFVVDVEVRDAPALIMSGAYDDVLRVIDSTGEVDSPATSVADLQPLSFQLNFDSTAHQGAVSPNGELAYLGHGQQPALVVVDLTTLTAVAGADLTGGTLAFDGTGSMGYVGSVTMSPNGEFLYAVLITNDHRSYFADTAATGSNISGRITDVAANMSDVVLVRIRRDTLVEVDRLTLISGAITRPRARMTQTTPDGVLGVIPVRREGAVYLVNLETMTIVDADADTAGEQPFDVSASSTEPHMAGINEAGTTLAVTYRGDGRNGPAHDDAIDLIDVATGALTQIAMTTTAASTNNKAAFLVFGQDGRLYYGRKEGPFALSVIDPAGPTELELLAGGQAEAAVFTADGQLLLRQRDSGLARFDPDANALVPFGGAEGPTTQPMTDFGFGHIGLLTPL